ncbi:MAG: M20 family metallopeptidase [Vicinamibacterales bacterium]
MHRLLDYAESERAFLLDTLEALVRAESPSTDKAAVDRCGATLARQLTALGAAVERLPQDERGDHVRAGFKGEGRPILLLGHIDTVWAVGQIGRMPFREEDGRLHGPGIFDMKAGIAAAMLAVRTLDTIGGSRPSITMLFTTDEEIGSGTSRAIIEAEARRSRAVLVLEPSLPGGGVKTSRKGCGDFELVVRGVSAHAGIAPGSGANAVLELARQIVALEALQDPERGVSVNVTVVAGGERTNVIPDIARASIDVRVPTMADARRIEQRIRSLSTSVPGTSLEVRGGVGRPPLERTAGIVKLYELARSCARQLGRELSEGGTGGGSDGNFAAALGVPTLDGLGPDGDGAHALHEHVVLADLPWRAAFLACLLSRIAHGGGPVSENGAKAGWTSSREVE